MRRQRRDVDAAPRGGTGDRGVVDVTGQGQQQLHPGGDAAGTQAGQQLSQGLQEQVAAAPVGAPGRDDVPFVGAAGEEVGQGELADDRGPGIGGRFGPRQPWATEAVLRDPDGNELVLQQA